MVHTHSQSTGEMAEYPGKRGPGITCIVTRPLTQTNIVIPETIQQLHIDSKFLHLVHRLLRFRKTQTWI